MILRENHRNKSATETTKGDREESLHNWSLKSVSWNFDEFLLEKELKYGNAS